MKKIITLFIGILLVTACNTTPQSNIKETSPKANVPVPKTIVEKTQVPVGVGAELVLNGTKYLVVQHIQNPNNNYHFRFLANDTEENLKDIKARTATYKRTLATPDYLSDSGAKEVINDAECFHGDTYWTWKDEPVWFSFWDENDKYLSMVDMEALVEKEIRILGCTRAIGWNGNEDLLIKITGLEPYDGSPSELTWAFNFKNQTFTKFEGN